MNEDGRGLREIKKYVSAFLMEANGKRLGVHFLVTRKPLPLSSALQLLTRQ
jgi:hypothetical protein